MEFYIVLVKLTEEARKRYGYVGAYAMGYTKQRLEEKLAKPFNQKKPFWFMGRQVHPDEVDTICIFPCTAKDPRNIVLPNGKSVHDFIDETNFDYILNCMSTGKVPDVQGVCTDDFLIPLEKTRYSIETAPKAPDKKNKIFIVHGRDKEQALELQKYLKDTLHQEAKLFEDVKKNFSSKTIIELLEYIVDNTAYAFVIATPDDFGCFGKDLERCEKELLLGKETVRAEEVKKLIAKLNRRARQNVVFEHGLFIGALGRDRVCCLLQEGVTEQESDIHGILYEGFKESVTEKFSDIESKLKDPKLGLNI